MKLIELSLNPAQVETLLIHDENFRATIVHKLFALASETLTLETFVGSIIRFSEGKIAAIKTLRGAYAENGNLFADCPSDYFQNSGLGLYGAKMLVEKYWDKYQPLS